MAAHAERPYLVDSAGEYERKERGPDDSHQEKLDGHPEYINEEFREPRTREETEVQPPKRYAKKKPSGS